MRVYKVIITKTVFVEAESVKDAKERALDDDFITTDEVAESAVPSTKREAAQMMMGGGAK